MVTRPDFTSFSKANREMLERLGCNAGGPVTWCAGETLSGERVAYPDTPTTVKYADKDAPAHESLVIGITTHAAVPGDPIMIQASGLITDLSWSWSPQLPIFLGNDGMLTQTVPTTGFVLQVGVAISATVIHVSIGAPVELA